MLRQAQMLAPHRHAIRQNLSKLSRLHTHRSRPPLDQSVCQQGLDERFLEYVIRKAIEFSAPRYTLPTDFFFKIAHERPDFFIETNINFDQLHLAQRESFPDREPITPAYLVCHVLDLRADIILASKYGGEYTTRPC